MNTSQFLLTSCFVCLGMSPSVYGQTQPTATLDGHGSGVMGMAFHSDGRRVVSVSFRDARIWDRTTGKEIVDLVRSRGFAAAFTPDGKRLAIGGFESVTIHDVATSRELSSFDPHGDWNRDFPFRPRVLAMRYSPNGRLLATAGATTTGRRGDYPPGIVKIFDASTGKVVRNLGKLTGLAVAVAFSPEGKYLAAGSAGIDGEVPRSGELRVWNAETSELLFVRTGDAGKVPGDNRWSANGVAFSPDGTRIASCGTDRIVRVWDIPAGQEMLTLRGHAVRVSCVSFNAQGDQILSADRDGGVRVWNANTGEQLQSITLDSGQTRSLNFSADARWLGIGGGNFKGPGVARVWQLSTTK